MFYFCKKIVLFSSKAFKFEPTYYFKGFNSVLMMKECKDMLRLTRTKKLTVYKK